MVVAKAVLISVGFDATLDKSHSVVHGNWSATTSSHNHNDWYVRRLNSHLKLVKQALNVKVTVFFISEIKTLELARKKRTREKETERGRENEEDCENENMRKKERMGVRVRKIVRMIV